MALHTITLPHLPPDLQFHIALYTNLRNASFLRSQLLAGNADFEYTFIDATTILSPTHLYAATFRASNDHLNHRIRTRNIHSEIVYCLGYTSNISTALNTFGISEKSTEMVVVKVSCSSLGLNPEVTRESVERHLQNSVEGEMVSFTGERLREVGDAGKVKKIYKLGTGKEGGKARRRKDGSVEGGRPIETARIERDSRSKAEEASERKELEVQILGLMALRGAV